MKLIRRTTAGLLYERNRFGPYRHDFNAGDWTASAGLSLSVSDGKLRITRTSSASDDRGLARLDAVASRSEVLIATRQTISGARRIGAAVHVSDIAAGSFDMAWLGLPAGFSATAILGELANDANTNLDTLASQNVGTPVSINLYGNGNAIAGWDSVTGRAWAGATATHVAGQVGAWESGSVGGFSELYSILVQAGRFVTVNGLAAGDVVEIRDASGAVLRSETESGSGSVAFDQVAWVGSYSEARMYVVRAGTDYGRFVLDAADYFAGGDVFELDETTNVDALLGATFTQTDTIDFQQQLAGFDTTLDPFDDDLSDYNALTSSAAATVGAGQLTIQNSSGGAADNNYSHGPDLLVPQQWVEIEVIGKASAAPSYDVIKAGIAKDSNNFIFAAYNRATSTVQIETRIAGTVTGHGTTNVGALSDFKIGLSLVGNTASLWLDTGSGWTYKFSYNLQPNIDLRSASLTGWKAAFSVASGGNGTWVLDNFTYGSFGGVGLKDISVVTEQDGTPVIVGSEVYFCASVAGPAGEGYQGVLKLDLDTHALTQRAVHFFERSSTKYQDLAGHIVGDGAGSYEYFISSWGTSFSNVHIYHGGYAATDVLNGVHLLGSLTQLALPNVPVGGGSYDPFAIKVGSVWYLAYTETSNFNSTGLHPALASSPDLATWTAVGAGTDASRNAEGTKLIFDQETLYLLATTPTAWPVYYATSLQFAQALGGSHPDASIWYGQPHPMVFRYGSRFVLLTFDDARFPPTTGPDYTWGNLLVFESEAVANTSPSPPTATPSNILADAVRSTLSAFSDPDVGDTQAAHQHRIRRTSDGAIIETSPEIAGASNVYDFTGLASGETYEVSGRQRDDSGDAATEWSAWGAWSDPASTTPAEIGPTEIVLDSPTIPPPARVTRAELLALVEPEPPDLEADASILAALATRPQDLEADQVIMAAIVENPVVPATEPCPLEWWDLTVFEDDDVTPILGTADLYGDPVEPSFTTLTEAQGGVRPYLEAPDTGPDESVDPVQCSARVSALTVTVLDKRTDPCDQATGVLTAALPDAGAVSQFIGHRALVRRLTLNLEIFPLLEGVVSAVRLNADKVSFDIYLKDLHERPRRTDLFTNNRSISIFPEGLTDGYGWSEAAQDYLIPAADEATGTFHIELLGSYIQVTGSHASDPISDVMAEVGVPDDEFHFPNLFLRWRQAGLAHELDPWNEIPGEHLLALNRFSFPTTSAFSRAPGGPLDIELGPELGYPTPSDGEDIVFQLLYNGATSEDFPYFWDNGTVGDLYRAVLDGEFSGGPLGVTYDDAAMEDISAATPRVRFIETEVAKDGLEWLTANVNLPFNILPVLDGDKALSPIFGDFPAAGALPFLDISNIEDLAADWAHEDSNAVGQVRFTYIREALAPTTSTVLQRAGPHTHVLVEVTVTETLPLWRLLVTREVVVEEIDAASSTTVKTDPLEIKPVTVRVFGTLDDAGVLRPLTTLADEWPYQFARSRGQDLIDRYKFGAPLVSGARASRSDPYVLAARTGDWFSVDLPWLPNYTTGQRGGEMIGQILSFQDVDYSVRSFGLVILPLASLTALDPPVIDTVTLNASGQVEVTLSDLGGGTTARVQIISGSGERRRARGGRPALEYDRAAHEHGGYRDVERAARLRRILGAGPERAIGVPALGMDCGRRDRRAEHAAALDRARRGGRRRRIGGCEVAGGRRGARARDPGLLRRA